MKRVIFAIATVALLFATSCKKESVNPAVDVPEGSFLATIDNGANPQNAPAVKDGMGTMTTITTDRYIIWSNGDQIKINGVAYTTGMSGNSVTFSPATQGQAAQGTEFHAFYPASIAGNGAAGTLPDRQVFDATDLSNLPMYASSNTRQLTFHNICAVLKITVPSYVNGATSIVVSSKQAMNGGFAVINNTAVMDAGATDYNKKLTVENSSGSFATGEVVYVAVPAQEYDSLKVEYFNGTTSLLYNVMASATLEVNKIYNLNMSEHQFVDLGLPSGRKWATTNVGAVHPWDYGDYYAWGEVEPYYETMTFSADRSSADFTWKTCKSAGYAWDSYRYGGVGQTTGTYDMTKYNATDGKTTLDTLGTIIDDAARANWGVKWHTPDSADWKELETQANWTWQTDYNGTGVKGYLVTSKSDASKFIFLPAAGFVDGENFAKGFKSTAGTYWSSSRSIDKPERAYYFGITSGSYSISDATRNYGRTIRPVCQ